MHSLFTNSHASHHVNLCAKRGRAEGVDRWYGSVDMGQSDRLMGDRRVETEDELDLGKQLQQVRN